MIARNSVFYFAEITAFPGELCEQRGEHPIVRVERLLELLDAIDN
jgi:hypothetical protein